MNLYWGSRGSGCLPSEASDCGGMQGGHGDMEGRLRWTRSSELYPLSSASPGGSLSACVRGAGAPTGGAALQRRERKVGGANEGADGAAHGLCGSGLVLYRRWTGRGSRGE
jgi:hypothetical protein